MTLSAKDICVRFNGNAVLGPLDLDIPSGTFAALLGPNGSGKTTLLRVLSGALHPSTGQVFLENAPLRSFSPREIARRIGVVPQSFHLDFNFTVYETVAMGRYTHHSLWEFHALQHLDHEKTMAALRAVGIDNLATRPVTQLSGGELQRVVLAQTLAQDTPVLLLDEPLNNLDLNHQLAVMQLLTTLNQQGRTILVVLHDINVASQYCRELVVLDRGQIVARGTPHQVLDPALILEVFKVRVVVHHQGQRPYVTPLWTRAQSVSETRQRKKIHVLAGGGAASPLLEELVLHGFAPSVGIVSVLDSDYSTAQRYQLEVVSSAPFEPFDQEAIDECLRLALEADVLIVAPVYFGRGNLALLDVALRTLEQRQVGPQKDKEPTRVLVFDDPPTATRDLADGRAVLLTDELLRKGARKVTSVTQLLQEVLTQSETSRA
ncbi:MAG: ABC transporter ATP-binding protein [Thermoleophilia bacterium]|nr:ABC transporter ATP-binding protein [Thermoleophilia bacterium]